MSDFETCAEKMFLALCDFAREDDPNFQDPVGWHDKIGDPAEDQGRDMIRRLTRIALNVAIDQCAEVADKRAAICQDACEKIQAGELYKELDTAFATENCARLEAIHIGKLIRDLKSEPAAPEHIGR